MTLHQPSDPLDTKMPICQYAYPSSPSSIILLLWDHLLKKPSSSIPTTGHRTTLHPEIQSFLHDNPTLHLGGEGSFHDERRHHLEVFGIHMLSAKQTHPIGDVEFTAIRGPHGTIPIRVLYPKSGEEKRKEGKASALIYFHGGGYTVGSVDEFKNGLRLLAEESGAQIYAIEYRLAPKFRYPTQLDEYSAIIDWLQGQGGKSRGVDPELVCGGGDSAGGNMTAAIALRRRDEGKRNMVAQMLLYPEAGVPPAAVFTSGFDPVKDVGVEYAHKLECAGNTVHWHHYAELTHGWLQLTAWSQEVVKAVKDIAAEMKTMVYREK